MIYNVVLVSDVHESDSLIHAHIYIYVCIYIIVGIC